MAANPYAVAAGLPLLKLRYHYQQKQQSQDRTTLEHRYDWYNVLGCTLPQGRGKGGCNFHARDKQYPPPAPWRVWLLLTGRRWGKTRAGAEWVRRRIEEEGARHIAFIAKTKADARDIMIEGPAGILAVSPPWNRPHYEPSKRRITWPSGAVATIFSADEPDQLRGPEYDTAWADEPAKWLHLNDILNSPWSNMQIGLSRATALGLPAQVVATTTPRSIKLIRDLKKDESCAVTIGHTNENLENLDESAKKEIVERYEGTRLGRQELAGEVLEDVEGALWQLAKIDELRMPKLNGVTLDRVVVAIDPSGSSSETASEQGIVVAGRGVCECKGAPDTHGFVLDDLSGHYTPEGWARRAIHGLSKHEGDRIIGEANFGGQMVEATLRAIDKDVPYTAVTASRGKAVRAEPIAAFYEQGKVHHVGTFEKLEEQLTTWVPGDTSPDRLDAVVWALTELLSSKKSIAVY